MSAGPDRRVTRCLAAVTVAVAAACHIEQRPPEPRGDEAAVLAALHAWQQQHAPADSGLRAARLDLRHEGDVATVWIGPRPRRAGADSEPLAVVVLRRGAAGWVVTHAERQRTPR